MPCISAGCRDHEVPHKHQCPACLNDGRGTASVGRPWHWTPVALTRARVEAYLWAHDVVCDVGNFFAMIAWSAGGLQSSQLRRTWPTWRTKLPAIRSPPQRVNTGGLSNFIFYMHISASWCALGWHSVTMSQVPHAGPPTLSSRVRASLSPNPSTTDPFSPRPHAMPRKPKPHTRGPA